jgi:fermentation-respiration switch protein FrsA (DUF1100 family)
VFAAGSYGAQATVVAGDVHAVITQAPGVAVVAFRGTVPSSWADWLRDFEAWPVRHEGMGWCHRGFLDGGMDLWPALQPLIAGRRVILTGHSLGGALAIITAGLMTLAGNPPEALVTFGAPRVGGSALRQLLAPIPIRQYRNGNDPVPDVPLLYEHVRLPLIEVGHPDLFDPLECHSCTGYGRLLAELASPPP